jgi:hypothetical protein
MILLNILCPTFPGFAETPIMAIDFGSKRNFIVELPMDIIHS